LAENEAYTSLHNVGRQLNNKSKIRLKTFSNANSAKCRLRSRFRSRDLWTSRSWCRGSRSWYRSVSDRYTSCTSMDCVW